MYCHNIKGLLNMKLQFVKNIIIALLVAGFAVTSVAQTAPNSTLTMDSILSAIGATPGFTAGFKVESVGTVAQFEAIAASGPAAISALATVTNSPEWETFSAQAAALNTYGHWMQVVSAAKDVVNNAPFDNGKYGKEVNPISYDRAFAAASSLFVFEKDNAWVNTWIENNANRIFAHNVRHPTVKVSDTASAKRVVVHDVAMALAQRDGSMLAVVGSVKRVEIMERRAAGLSVIGKDALPKTAALTAAINSGNGLAAALQAFIGNDFPSIPAAIAKKQAAAQALKDEFNAGLKDPTPGGVAFIGAWLGVEPTAAWVKQYNGQ